jgi:hypothetical protein
MSDMYFRAQKLGPFAYHFSCYTSTNNINTNYKNCVCVLCTYVCTHMHTSLMGMHVQGISLNTAV